MNLSHQLNNLPDQNQLVFEEQRKDLDAKLPEKCFIFSLTFYGNFAKLRAVEIPVDFSVAKIKERITIKWELSSGRVLHASTDQLVDAKNVQAVPTVFDAVL